MADDWFYAQKQERNGPVSFAKLQSLAKAGWLTPEDLVWGPGMATWKPAREVEGLFWLCTSRQAHATAGPSGKASRTGRPRRRSRHRSAGDPRQGATASNGGQAQASSSQAA